MNIFIHFEDYCAKFLTLRLGFLKIGSIKAEELREKYFASIAIKKFRKLRQKWIKFCGFWLLKDVPISEAKLQIKSINSEISTDEQIEAYLSKIIATPVDESKPLWEIHIKENYQENSSVVFIVFNHLIADGMGFINLITFLNDNHNPENIVAHRSIPFISKYLIPLLYIPLGILRFTLDSYKIRGDPNLTPLHLKNGVQSLKKSYHKTRYFEMKDLREQYSKFPNTKLNSYMFGIISSAL